MNISPLKKIRLEKKLSLTEVARAVDMDPGNYSRLESKTYQPFPAATKKAEKIIELFNGEISEAEIFFPERYPDKQE